MDSRSPFSRLGDGTEAAVIGQRAIDISGVNMFTRGVKSSDVLEAAARTPLAVQTMKRWLVIPSKAGTPIVLQ